MFRAAELEPAIQLRGDNANEVVKRDIARYYRLIDQELSSITLEPADWKLIREAITSGSILDNPTPADFYAAIERMSELSGAYTPTVTAIAAQLEPLTPGRMAALFDYAERWQPQEGEKKGRS